MRVAIKDATIFSKVSADIHFTIKQVARSLGLTESEYIRFVVIIDLERRGLLDEKIRTDALEQLVSTEGLPA
jgi:hypothetical protein